MRRIAIINQKGGVGKTTTAEKRCTTCQETKPASAFYPRRKRGNLAPECIACVRARHRQWRLQVDYPVSVEEKECSKCQQIMPASQFKREKSSHDGLTGLCRECIEQNAQRWRKKCRKELLDAYGHACACCGETTGEFLSLDHIQGGGRRHRASFSTQTALYRYLKKQGFPKDQYRLLCHNCNQAIGIYGYCPHQRRNQSLEISL